MVQAIGFKEVGKLLSQAVRKGSLQTAIVSQAQQSAKEISVRHFGYDFTGLVIRLLVFFAVAFFIEWFMKARIFVQQIATDPSLQVPVVSGLFGLGGIIFNAFFQLFKQPTEEQPIVTPTQSNALFGNSVIQQVFSDEGYKGFKFWDIIKIIAIILVILEWKKYRDQVGGDVKPLTTGLFILIIIGLGLTVIPDKLAKFKTTDFNLESLR